MTELALFDAAPYLVPTAEVEPGEKLSAGRRLTLRQAADLARGRHPLTGGPLHPDAAPHDDRSAPGARCGSCRFRALFGHHDRTYPKCSYPVPTRDGEPIHPADHERMTRVAHSAASDCRSWWPACISHQPRAEA
jgi:hypothetical protein